MRLIRYQDDHGDPVRLSLVGVRLVLARHLRHVRPVRSVGALVWRGLKTGPVVAAVGGMAIISLLMIILVQDRSTGFGLVVFSPVAVPLLSLGMLSVRGLIGVRGGLPEAMRLAMLHAQRCPACAYDLAGRQAVGVGVAGGPEHDEVVRCSECGAAWDAQRLGADAYRGPTVVVVDDVPSGL